MEILSSEHWDSLSASAKQTALDELEKLIKERRKYEECDCGADRPESVQLSHPEPLPAERSEVELGKEMG